MNPKFFVSIFFVLISHFIIAQEKHIAHIIDTDLKENSNAVVRSNITEVYIESIDQIIVKNHRIITVLNEAGESKVNGVVHYDNGVTIKRLEAIIFNAFGNEIKRYRKKDFKDVSVADGISIYNDNRAKYFDYTATSYPYTVEFISKTIRTNTAFIPRWLPVEGYYVSTEFSSFKVVNNTNIELSKKVSNFKDFPEIKELSEFQFTAENLSAMTYEAYSPSFNEFAPNVKFALKAFSMEGVKGTNKNWKDFGKWMNDKLIKDTDVLPQEVKNEAIELTKNVVTPLEKAKIIYQYMQNKSRYVSIQVGIGGWKPMLASDVDRLGYGDCKGLSNYTKALLDAVGVESFYTVVYGDNNIKNLDDSFSSLEGNHVILSLLIGGDYTWLECTSKQSPFGYNANFTDDRDVLLVTPNGGEIVHTKAYKTVDNIQETNAKVTLDNSGNIVANLNIIYKGSQYDNHTHVESKILKDQKLFYKNNYDNINNLKIINLNIENNKDTIEFKEYLELNAANYASKAGNALLFSPNLFNRIDAIPIRYDVRKLPFEIDRGYVDNDTYEISIPENFIIDDLREDIDISNKFGNYKVSLTKQDNNTLLFKRSLTVYKGKYKKEDYKDFRKFILEINKNDKNRIAIKSIK